MKPLVILLLSFLIFYHTNAQSSCDDPTNTDEMNVNSIESSLPITGFISAQSFGQTFSYYNDDLEEQKDLDIDIKLWVAGLDPLGNLKMAAQTYSTLNGDNDFWTGPLDPATGTTNAANCSDWDQQFTVTRSDIEIFLTDFIDGNVDQPIPPSVLYWPARGNNNFFDQYGFELPNTSQGLAPFLDQNENGAYEPELGDYPFIKGADKAVWRVINDAGGVHTESNSNAMNAEIQIMAYAYDVPNNAVNNSIFYDLKFINRGIERLDQMTMSLWTDHNIGNCGLRQFSGCVPNEDIAFFYSNLTLSGDCVCNNIVLDNCIYPIVAVKLLQTPYAAMIFDENGELIPAPSGIFPDTLAESGLSSFIYYNNGSVGMPPPNTIDPQTAQEYYQYMNAKYRDGSPVIYNGEEVKYMSSGNPANFDEWSFCNGEDYIVSDYRSLMNMSGFILDPGAVSNVSFVVSVNQDINTPCPDTDVLVDYMDDVKNFWEESRLVGINEPVSNSSKIKAFPNPMLAQTTFSLEEPNENIQYIQLINTMGQIVFSSNNINQQQISISRNDLEHGVYFYKIKTSKQHLFTGKLLVQ